MSEESWRDGWNPADHFGWLRLILLILKHIKNVVGNGMFNEMDQTTWSSGYVSKYT